MEKVHPGYGRRDILRLILASWPFNVCTLVELHPAGLELAGIPTREKVRVRKGEWWAKVRKKVRVSDFWLVLPDI